MEIEERHLHFLGLAMIFFVVTATGFNAFFQLITREAAKKVKNPVMNLEFVKTTAEVEAITDKQPEARKALKTFLLLDSFAFVPLYFGFLLLMSFFMSRSSFIGSQIVALVVVLAAVVAATADWTENFYSYVALDAVALDMPKNVSQIFLAAHVKWISIFIAIGVTSLFFWRDGGWWLGGAIILFSSVAALFGLFFFRPLITVSLSFQFLIILVFGILFLFSNCRINFLQNP